MRSATSAAALLLALAAIFTECHTAQSERTRQRSGPIRSVPVGADVKRDKDFDCPEEFGYYPHPTDCTLYYVCVFGGALLESCTGGLMYSHELQTCDWPRNVGCDATSPVNEELERFSERDPPPPPRRTPSPPPPPPLPRAQPNPVVTSRGQPQITISREEYEKQQKLYEEIDDLPPVEEIENDRQQRVYRGQPSTIGQVQRDRDGYTQVNTGRTLNSNIIPASIPQSNSKIGSFSFGTQIDERRQQTVTPAPQTYSGDTTFNALDSTLDKPIDFDSNSIDNSEATHSRPKRDVSTSVTESTNPTTETTTFSKEISDRKDGSLDFYSALEDERDLGSDGEEEEDEEEEEMDESDVDESSDDNERGKRQIRNGKYYYNVDPGLKNHAKYWNNQKQQNSGEIRNFNNRPPQTFQNIRHHSSSTNGLNNHNLHESTKFPYDFPFDQFSSFESESQKPFKASLRDPFSGKQQEPINSASHIITKSPPISSLSNEGNSFTAFASGGFFNNNPKQTKQSSTEQNFYGSSRSPNVNMKSPNSGSNENHNRYLISPNHNYNNKDNDFQPTKQSENQYESDSNESDESDESVSAETESNRKHNIDNFYNKDEHHDPYDLAKHEFKFKEVVNPFAAPDFDFDAFLAKISGNYFTEIKTTTPKPRQSESHSVYNSDLRPATHSYKRMSTPRPFSVPTGEPVNLSPQSGKIQENVNNINRPIKFEDIVPKPPKFVQDHQQTVINEQIYNKYHQFNAGRPLESIRPHLRPPNFKDERNLPLNLNFYQDTSAPKPNLYHGVPSSTSKPYFYVTTGKPLILSSPKQRLVIKPENILAHLAVTGNPYSFANIRPSDYYSYKTTQRPFTTASDELSVLQNFWGNQSVKAQIYSTRTPVTTTELPKLENLFSLKPSGNRQVSTTTKTPKRIPIPKPSPEMSDYYYDDDEIYYEPPVKSQYMPSTEVRPQRPPMAQNYQEYDDSEEDSSEESGPSTPATRIPANHKPEKPTNHNNFPSSQTPFKATIKDGKLSVPVLVDYNTQSHNSLKRPEIANYEIVHPSHKNRTYLRRPIQESGPNTNKPPKYLNQTTLRPYTVRHRLAKPTTVSHSTPKPSTQETTKPSRGKTRHPNIVTEMIITTPRDSQKQETRYTKTRHDGRINSLEPTESVTPATYSVNPKPKMLYNGSQTYNPDQYDPYYAVYDEDGELYRETDFVQQYNSASLRPAVQQTYRGTPPPPPPPPARRPVETYTPRPQATVDYDDALIRGQINQNQYQSTIRHSTRGEGNELGYDNTQSSVRTTQFEVKSTTPTATSTSTTTTQRPTVAPFTEAMTPSQYSQRPTAAPTRGRGSAHYSTLDANAPAPQSPNRGTPPNRGSRPTLKPSTSIVSKVTEFVDVYAYPPRRPSAVYPQPTPDKTAAKCRKDVCLLPDCSCGGKDIPADMPVESVPQMVLLTFDDSVNDLNKVLYTDLFEKGRVNPNGCPISSTFYVSHEWTDYSQVQNLYAAGHEMASHTISHSFGEQFSQKKWNREVAGQREILAAYGGVKLEDVRGMRAPFLSVGGNKMFKMLYDSNFTYDSSMPVYENRPPSWPYTLDYKLFHDCMIPPCPTKSYPGVWEVPMVMWQDLNGGRCSMGDACANPQNAEGVYKMILKNFDRHYTTNRAPFGLFYHAAWFTQPHHKEGFIMFLDFINQMDDVWIITNWQALQWVRDPTPINRLNNFQPFQCNYQDRPKKCNNPKVCNLWHKSGVRYMRTCQPCPEIYPWTGKTGIRSSRIDNDIEEN